MLTREAIFAEDLFPREIIPSVERDLDKKEALFILGSRRAGKTSVLLLLARTFLNKGARVSFFDLENPDDIDVVAQGPEALMKFTNGGIIFIDEIHYLDDPSRFIKLAVDHFPEMKLICTGSSSLAFHIKYRDSLIGRVIEYELFPLSFREFLTFKAERFLNLLPDFDFRNPRIPDLRLPEKIEELFEEYVVFGGYPESVLAEKEDKIRFLSRMFRIYAKRDLKNFYSLREEKVFERFFLQLAARVGSLLNLNEIARELGVSFKTLKKYLFLIENLYLIKILHPFKAKIATSIRKMPKVYFVDTGLLSWALGNFESLEKRPDAGHLVENSVFIRILNRLSPAERIYFLRKKSGVEVDFIITRGKEKYAIEVKWKRHPAVNKNSLKILEALTIEKFLVFSKKTVGTKKIDDYQIAVMPAFLA